LGRGDTRGGLWDKKIAKKGWEKKKKKLREKNGGNPLGNRYLCIYWGGDTVRRMACTTFRKTFPLGEENTERIGPEKDDEPRELPGWGSQARMGGRWD